ncbi:Hypothetical predicted protein [Cloeon dipterum]|uniref:Uncharacterized protein n=1 Tax=Cloeon dipterum TaxID=197152 RepID=A0A8S1E077_9INSE|nr:Hypothetical predicted protein [Cloeon dipterum]
MGKKKATKTEAGGPRAAAAVKPAKEAVKLKKPVSNKKGRMQLKRICQNLLVEQNASCKPWPEPKSVTQKEEREELLRKLRQGQADAKKRLAEAEKELRIEMEELERLGEEIALVNWQTFDLLQFDSKNRAVVSVDAFSSKKGTGIGVSFGVNHSMNISQSSPYSDFNLSVLCGAFVACELIKRQGVRRMNIFTSAKYLSNSIRWMKQGLRRKPRSSGPVAKLCRSFKKMDSKVTLVPRSWSAGRQLAEKGALKLPFFLESTLTAVMGKKKATKTEAGGPRAAAAVKPAKEAVKPKKPAVSNKKGRMQLKRICQNLLVEHNASCKPWPEPKSATQKEEREELLRKLRQGQADAKKRLANAEKKLRKETEFLKRLDEKISEISRFRENDQVVGTLQFDSENHCVVSVDGYSSRRGTGFGVSFGAEHKLNVSQPFSKRPDAHFDSVLYAAFVACETLKKLGVHRMSIFTSSKGLYENLKLMKENRKKPGSRGLFTELCVSFKEMITKVTMVTPNCSDGRKLAEKGAP